MKTKYLQAMSLLLAAQLQVMPLLRSFLPNTQGLAPSAWGFILKLGVGATALLGFDAVSQASSIAISPANATVGVAYVGTVSYSGGHSGSVTSMMMSNNCLSSPYPLGNGLSIVYAGGNKATVTGTPLAANPNESFTLKMWNGACSGSHSDTRSTSLVVGAGTGGAVAPTITATPPNTCAQVGSEVLLSGGATGNPIPQYQWWSGLTPIAGATNSILDLTNLQLTNAGIYTLTASNSQTAGFTFGSLPKASCYLSVCISAGTNFSVLDYTNYAPAGVPLTMFSYVTNVSSATNYYSWTYNGSPTPILSTSNTLPLSAAILTPAKSGTYTVAFNSTNSGGAIVSGQNYDSYWAFGYLPMFTNSLPVATNVSPGASVTFNIAVGGNLDVFNYGGPGTYVTNSGTPCVFWYQNGSLVAAQSYVCGPTTATTYSNSAVNATLTLNGITSANAGSYVVVATNYWGSITSSPVALSVTSSANPPVITTNPPAALALLAGQSSAISVTVTGTPPFSYQWRKGGTNLTNGGVYGGVLTNTLTLNSVTTGNSGSYTVAITNSAGAITSSVTTVSIALPPSVTASAGTPGIFQLNGNTSTGLTYVVQMATNLTGAAWSPVQTNNTGLSGTISFQTNTASGPNQFYRLTFP
jgi:hypothetical protein